jgi:hypothetical protein
MAKTKSKINWATIANEFRALLADVQKCKIASTEERDRYKASLSAPEHIRSPLLDQFAHKQRHAITGEDRLEMFHYSLGTLGLETPFPEFTKDVRKRWPNHMEIVEKAIDQRCASTEFFQSWGEIKFAFGIFNAILLYDSSAEDALVAQLSGGVKSGDTTIQQHWYAYWLEKGDLFEGHETRGYFNDEIADLCLDIYEGRREAVDYDKSWFKSLIYLPWEDKNSKYFGNRDADYRLNRIYTDLTIAELKTIIEKRVIKWTEVPPLSEDCFPLISQM